MSHTKGKWGLRETSQSRAIGVFDKNGDGTLIALLPAGSNPADVQLLLAAPKMFETLKKVERTFGDRFPEVIEAIAEAGDA